MDPIKKRKYLKIWGLTSLALIFVFPEIVFETTVSIIEVLFDYALEFGHLLFEAVESALDHIVEHFFETDLQSTQAIVFYILLAIACYPLYRLIRLLLRGWRYSKESCNYYWGKARLSLSNHWQETTLVDKIKWAVISVLVIYVYVSFFI